jgi:hypothetical protein
MSAISPPLGHKQTSGQRVEYDASDPKAEVGVGRWAWLASWVGEIKKRLVTILSGYFRDDGHEARNAIVWV